MVKYWRIGMIVLLAIGFFAGAASYNYFAQQDNFVKFGSPDETANYVFAKLYGQTGKMELFEKYNLYAGDIMHPRSARSDAGMIKPVSFLGIILIYGKIVSLTSYKILPFLTPLFGAIGILFFYLLIKKIFGKRNAFISAFLLASFPVYIYYSARSMFHNVLFMVLLIIGLYFLVLMCSKSQADASGRDAAAERRQPVRDTARSRTGCSLSVVSRPLLRSTLFALPAGLLIGLAIITRTSELLWIAPMLFILWLFNIRKVGVIKLILFLCSLFLAVMSVFYYNQILYGDFWKGGYSEMNQSIVQIAEAGSDLMKGTAAGRLPYYRELLSRVKSNIFYFGFKPDQSMDMFKNYFVKMFYWIFWPAVLGLVLFARKIRKWKRKHIAYLLSYFTVSLILIFYYGSWQFYDNPDPSQITIGNSYTRYWLPIYLGALPFASMFIVRITKLAKKKNLITAGRIIIVGLIFFISMRFVLFGSEEGLVYSYNKQRQAKYEFDRVLALTEPNAVIITQYHDKLFFPERKVILGLFDNKDMVARYAKIADYLPVYYYNFALNQDAINYLNARRLGEVGLGIEEIEKVTENFTLYKLHRLMNF